MSTSLIGAVVAPVAEAAVSTLRDHARRAYRDLTLPKIWHLFLNLVVALVLLSAGALLLSGLAVTSYVYFYHNYLPQQVTTVPVHLQYGFGAHPYGFASMANLGLKTRQPYDITVTLVLPRSPANLDRGNFMVSLRLLDGDPPPLSSPVLPYDPAKQQQLVLTPPPGQADPRAHAASQRVLFAAARPAILPYTHPTVARVSRLAFLAYHVLFPHAAETTTLRVPLAEHLAFSSGGALVGLTPLPRGLLVEVRAGQDLQVYEASVTLTARLRGLRWLMYNHRVLSFLAFASAFWLCELVGMACMYFLLRCAGWRRWEREQHKPGRGPGQEGIRRPAWGTLAGPRGGGEGDDDDDDDNNNNDQGRGGDGGRAGTARLSAKVKGKMKAEPAMSDTERTFPSTSKQPQIKFESAEMDELLRAIESDSGEVVEAEDAEEEKEQQQQQQQQQRQQQEEGEEEATTTAMTTTATPGPTTALASADADDDDEASFRDSGIGTSHSDRTGREGPSARRRSSAGKRAASS